MSASQPSTYMETFYSSEIIQKLEETAYSVLTFKELTHHNYPFKITSLNFMELQEQFRCREAKVFKAGADCVCIPTSQGACWLPSSSKSMEILQEALVWLEAGRLLPLWMLTTEEIIAQHIQSLKHLILAAVYDNHLIQRIKIATGMPVLVQERELRRAENSVRDRVETLRYHLSKLGWCSTESASLYERCCITCERLSRGDLRENELGYSAQELWNVRRLLGQRCHDEFPAFQYHLRGMRNVLIHSLLECETIQCRRAHQWDRLLQLPEIRDAGFAGSAQVAALENAGYSALIRIREKELNEVLFKEKETRPVPRKQNVVSQEPTSNSQTIQGLAHQLLKSPRRVFYMSV